MRINENDFKSVFDNVAYNYKNVFIVNKLSNMT